MSRGSILPAGMVLSGEIRGQGDLVVAGTIEGPVQIDGHLVIEPGASVRGDVKARSIVLRGTLLGPAIAEETIKLESGARMVGDARAERVSVVEGAMLRGRITMTGVQPTRRSSAGGVVAPVAEPAEAPRLAPPARPPAAEPPGGPIREPLREAASPMPRSAGGVLSAPRPARAPDAFDEDNRTNRFVRPGDLSVTRSSTPPPVEPAGPAVAERAPMASPPRAAEPAPRTRDRRPPEPVIPGVGRQRARRKDGGAST